MSDNKNAAESMDDILASIRETVEEETGVSTQEKKVDVNAAEKAAGPQLATPRGQVIEEEQSSAELPEIDADAKSVLDSVAAAVAAEMAGEGMEDDLSGDAVLDLTDMVSEDSGDSYSEEEPEQHEEVVDIEAFSQTGEISPAGDEKLEEARKNYQEVDTVAEETETSVEEMMEEPQAEEVAEEMVEEAAVEEEPAAEEVAQEEVQEEEVAQEIEEPVAETSVEELVASAVSEKVVKEVAAVPTKLNLSTVPTANGLQVGFPVEVLAEALRPMVKDWVKENLPDIVERLVKEELSRLAER